MDGAVLHFSGHGDTRMADMATCKLVYETLCEQYPGHQWMVGADAFAGTVEIKLLYLNPLKPWDRYGCRIHLASLKTAHGLRKVIRYGGELLERYGLPRRGFREGDNMKAIEHGMHLDGAF